LESSYAVIDPDFIVISLNHPGKARALKIAGIACLETTSKALVRSIGSLNSSSRYSFTYP
jgi:hypothetical protein